MISNLLQLYTEGRSGVKPSDISIDDGIDIGDFWKVKTVCRWGLIDLSEDGASTGGS